MHPGLPTPLHLTANLLGLAAAVGLAAVVLARPGVGRLGPRARVEWLVAGGAALVAVGHGLAGALVEGAQGPARWLVGGGLVLIAVGLARRRPAVLAGGGVRRAGLLGLGLLAWMAAWALSSTAAPVSGLSPAEQSAWATVAGALAIGGWIWQVSSARLLAKLVTAFVASLLAVVVLLGVVLASVGTSDLVDEQLRALDATSAGLAQELADWPGQAVAAASILKNAAGPVGRLAGPRDRDGLDELLVRVFSPHDFITVLAPDGRVMLSSHRVDALGDESFLLALAGAPPVERLVSGESREDGGLMSVGGKIVGFGGVRVFDEGEIRAEDPPRFIVVTGRIADDVWAAGTAQRMQAAVLVDVGGRITAASEEVAGVDPEAVLATLGADAQAVRGGPNAVFAAANWVRDPVSRERVGRVIAASSGQVLVQVAREQAQRLFLLTLLAALVAGIATAVFSRRLVAPIRRLTEAAAAVREGNLDVQADARGRDEVGELGRTFNEMTASLATQSTQLREAAEEQSRLRARLEAMTSSMSDALVAVDVDGRVLAFNPAAERLVEREAAQALGLPLQDVLTGPARAPSPAAVLGKADSEATGAAQVLLETASGRIVPTAATAAPVRDADGRILGRVLVLRDVTREVEVERMKTEFLSNVSHELRTPLTPIRGYAEVLARRDVGAKATQRFAEQILASTARLERIVGMIVDFAALDSGRMRPRREAVEAGDVVGEALARWREREPQREFRRRVPVALPPLLVDPVMLHRCLDELLDNAVKFSPGGEPVSVTAGLVGDRVRLSVRDRGVGMDVNATAEVFGDFYQLDGSETRHFGGLGLGLALVRRIVDALDGETVVESRLGRGSAFHVLLPSAHPAPQGGPSGNGTRRRSRDRAPRTAAKG